VFAAIQNWVLGGFRARSWQGPQSLSSEAREKEWAEDLLLSVPRRRQVLAEVEDLLVGLPKGERRDLVTRTAIRFALYAVDLPASERDHDSRPFGLLDHSLAVARAAAGELVRPGFRVSEDPAENYREQPIWAYSGFVLGLLHDAGKILDLEVRHEAGGPAWNPQAESLAAYLTRLGRRRSGPESWHWKKGRGTRSYVEALPALVPLLVPAPAKSRLGSRLGRLIQGFRGSCDLGREVWARDPAGRVVSVVRHWDQELSRAGGAPSRAPEAEHRAEASPAAVAAGPSNPPELPAVGETLDRDAATAPAAEPSGSPAPPVPDPPSGAIASPAPDPVPRPPNAETPGGTPDPRSAQELQDKQLRDAKIERELQPAQLLRSIREAIKSAKVSRNGSRGPVFICKDYIWLKYPEAFMRVMEHVGLRFSAPIGERILGSLLGCPGIVPEDPRSALVLGVVPPRGKASEAFVRFRAQGFFPEEVLAQLGLWPHEIRIPPRAVPRAPESRQLPLWPERRP